MSEWLAWLSKRSQWEDGQSIFLHAIILIWGKKSHLFCSVTFAIYCFKRQVGRTLGEYLEKHMYLFLKGRCRQTSFWYEIRMRIQNYLVNRWCVLRSARHWAIFSLLRHCPSLGWCSWQSSQRSLKNHS